MYDLIAGLSEDDIEMSTVFNALYTLWNQIVYAISNVRIFDFIDIFVIAYIIYKAIGFLRETRAGQLVKGLAVLLIMYLFSVWFDLAVIRWVLSIVVNSALIIIAIIFQPELRRILERVGQAGLSHGAMNETDNVVRCIDEVCKAAGIMQNKKIGALIVFERNTQLGEIINTGTIVDAAPSISMVNNIFYPKSPLHDGALIVRKGRLYAAGCILPLTQSQSFSSSLGTRHRAAIGMTENSDSVVLIVSEETGNISIAFNGKITRNYNVESAFAEIRDKLVVSEVEENSNIIISSLKRFPLFKKRNTEKQDKEEKADEN